MVTLILEKFTSLFLSSLYNHASSIHYIALILMTTVLILSFTNENSTSLPLHCACETLYLTMSHIHELSNRQMENMVVFNPCNFAAQTNHHSIIPLRTKNKQQQQQPDIYHISLNSYCISVCQTLYFRK
jgi:hypothetical protein